MVGNMVGSSLAMAPSFVLGQLCDVVDLDGPTFLKHDPAPRQLRAWHDLVRRGRVGQPEQAALMRAGRSRPCAAAPDRAAMSSRFQRFLLPGFAFKAVVIGGGYATGRELAEFFLPSGPWGGIAAMLLAMLIWSIVCVATFLFAR